MAAQPAAATVTGGHPLCGRTQDKLDALLEKHVKEDGSLTPAGKYIFFIGHANCPDDVLKAVVPDDKLPRCIKCGRTIDEHPAEGSFGGLRAHDSPDAVPPAGAHVWTDLTFRTLTKYIGRIDAESTSSRSKYPPEVELPSYVGKCAICGYSEGDPKGEYPFWESSNPPVVSRAHIVPKQAIEELGWKAHVSHFLPLCGSKGWRGSCRDGWDKRLFICAYIGAEEANDGKYVIFSTESKEPYTRFHNKEVCLPNVCRTAVQVHASLSLDAQQVEPRPEMLSMIRARRWSPETPDADDTDGS